MKKEIIISISIAVIVASAAILGFLLGYDKHRQEQGIINEQQVIDEDLCCLPAEYQFIVTDDSLTVYDSRRVVGTIKLQGQLDSLITLDNQ
jgi:hypothetical protein